MTKRKRKIAEKLPYARKYLRRARWGLPSRSNSYSSQLPPVSWIPDGVLPSGLRRPQAPGSPRKRRWPKSMNCAREQEHLAQTDRHIAELRPTSPASASSSLAYSPQAILLTWRSRRCVCSKKPALVEVNPLGGSCKKGVAALPATRVH
jgi:hypothetical protein